MVYDASKLRNVFVVKPVVLGLQRAPESSELAPSVLVLSYEVRCSLHLTTNISETISSSLNIFVDFFKDL